MMDVLKVRRTWKRRTIASVACDRASCHSEDTKRAQKLLRTILTLVLAWSLWPGHTPAFAEPLPCNENCDAAIPAKALEANLQVDPLESANDNGCAGRDHCIKLEVDEDLGVEAKPRYLRAFGELGLIVALGTTWYWIDRERQVGDWDYSSWENRFSRDSLTNDHNPFRVNYSWHTLAGAGFQLIGRSNGMGVLSSLGLSTATSLAWEYGIEFKEKLSVNDLIFTPGAGIAAGEFFFRLGEYLRTVEGRTGAIARWTLGLPQTVHDRMTPGLLSAPPIWHRFRFSYGFTGGSLEPAEMSESAPSLQMHSLRADARLIALEGYLQPGRRSEWFGSANFTSFAASLSAGPDGTGTDVFADTLVAGWRTQDLPRRGDTSLGTAMNLGTSVAFTYHREHFGPWRDRLGALHLPGLAFDGDLYGQRWQLRSRLRLHADYAGVEALPNAAWSRANPDELGKRILREQGYYYAWGASARAFVELSTSRVDVGASGFYGYYDSQEGFDRDQDDLTIDQQATAHWLDAEAWLRGRVTPSMYLELRAAHLRRTVAIEELEGRQRSLRYTAELGFEL